MKPTSISVRTEKGGNIMKHTDNNEWIQEELFTAEGWDGEPRIDTLFSDYLGVDDTPYTREVSRRFCVGAVAGVMEHSRQTVLPVLFGPQGCGKTTLLNALCGGWEYFSDFFFAEDSDLLIGQSLICEIGATRTDFDILKAILNDDAKRPGTFCATSIDTNGQTGDGTIVPLQCHADPVHGRPAKKSPWELTNDIREVRQIWAEAYAAWKDSLK